MIGPVAISVVDNYVGSETDGSYRGASGNGGSNNNYSGGFRTRSVNRSEGAVYK